MKIPVVSSLVSSSRITSSATSSQPMSTLLTDPVSSSSFTVASVEDPYTSTFVTSTSALAMNVGILSSLEVTSASAAAPEIVSASSEVPISLATLEITASTNPVVSFLSASASLSESPTTITELLSTATAPLATSEVTSAEVDTISSIALSTCSRRSSSRPPRPHHQPLTSRPNKRYRDHLFDCRSPGSNLNCALGVKVTQGSNPNQVRNMQAWLYIDNQCVNPGTNNYFTGTSSSLGANDWRRIGGAGVANAQDVHTVIFAMQSNLGGVYNQGTAKYIRIRNFAAESPED
ncbi:hypothetical protein IG631_05474 [Alternaria alternata]|nr:hypothetical protein IG631_05474 [Alternaria alternata]